MQNQDFQQLLWHKARELYRDMPWRDDVRPYYVLVSELMLQQTQVARVIPKFNAFIDAFPDETTLASASLADVLKQWQGLGYNRRAKFLHDAARMITIEFNGLFPDRKEDILRLPGVGKNTLGAIQAYAFNRPTVFIETNVRTVYIHHFFDNQFEVDDKALAGKLSETLDHEHPREFYWALMDYGSWLKTNGVRNNDKSRHYKKQSPLEGSIRQVRGKIIGALTQESEITLESLRELMPRDERFELALESLTREGLVSVSDASVRLTK